MARQLRSTAYTCMYVSVYVSAVMRRLLVARKALSTHTHTKRWRPMWTTSECAFALFYLQMYIYVCACFPCSCWRFNWGFCFWQLEVTEAGSSCSCIGLRGSGDCQTHSSKVLCIRIGICIAIGMHLSNYVCVFLYAPIYIYIYKYICGAWSLGVDTIDRTIKIVTQLERLQFSGKKCERSCMHLCVCGCAGVERTNTMQYLIYTFN